MFIEDLPDVEDLNLNQPKEEDKSWMSQKQREKEEEASKFKNLRFQANNSASSGGSTFRGAFSHGKVKVGPVFAASSARLCAQLLNLEGFQKGVPLENLPNPKVGFPEGMCLKVEKKSEAVVPDEHFMCCGHKLLNRSGGENHITCTQCFKRWHLHCLENFWAYKQEQLMECQRAPQGFVCVRCKLKQLNSRSGEHTVARHQNQGPVTLQHLCQSHTQTQNSITNLTNLVSAIAQGCAQQLQFSKETRKEIHDLRDVTQILREEVAEGKRERIKLEKMMSGKKRWRPSIVGKKKKKKKGRRHDDHVLDILQKIRSGKGRKELFDLCDGNLEKLKLLVPKLVFKTLKVKGIGPSSIQVLRDGLIDLEDQNDDDSEMCI